MQQFIDELSSQKTYSNSRLIINDFLVLLCLPLIFCGAFFFPLTRLPLVTPFLARG